MFDHLLEVNNLSEEFKKYNLSESDLTFIKEQIAGPKRVDGDINDVRFLTVIFALAFDIRRVLSSK